VVYQHLTFAIYSSNVDHIKGHKWLGLAGSFHMDFMPVWGVGGDYAIAITRQTIIRPALYRPSSTYLPRYYLAYLPW